MALVAITIFFKLGIRSSCYSAGAGFALGGKGGVFFGSDSLFFGAGFLLGVNDSLFFGNNRLKLSVPLVFCGG